VQQLFLQDHPDLEFTFANYPVPSYKIKLSKLAVGMTWTSLGMLFFGDKVFETMGRPTPQFYHDLADKKMLVGLGIWFLSGTIQQNLMQTGAFEVYYNSLPVFSKLEMNRMPMRDELIDGLGLAMQESKMS
jgi:selT/selW/selH-like putative selenoprotein